MWATFAHHKETSVHASPATHKCFNVIREQDSGYAARWVFLCKGNNQVNEVHPRLVYC